MGGPRRTVVVLPADAEWHGTSAGYVGRGCGCERCKRWNRERMRGYQERLRQREAEL